jgi:hypothetical protein
VYKGICLSHYDAQHRNENLLRLPRRKNQTKKTNPSHLHRSDDVNNLEKKVKKVSRWSHWYQDQISREKNPIRSDAIKDESKTLEHY